MPRFLGLKGALYAGPTADFLAFLLAITLVILEVKKIKKMKKEVM